MIANVAQLIEQVPCKHQVVGLIPTVGSSLFNLKKYSVVGFCRPSICTCKNKSNQLGKVLYQTDDLQTAKYLRSGMLHNEGIKRWLWCYSQSKFYIVRTRVFNYLTIRAAKDKKNYLNTGSPRPNNLG